MDENMHENNPLLGNEDIHNEYIQQYKKTRRKNMSFVFGLVVVIFSLIGFFGCIAMVVDYIGDKNKIKSESEFSVYNEFLIAVAAVDPVPFDDITAAESGELVEIAVWSIIGSDLEPDKYDYSSGELAIPASDVESAYVRYFGTQLPIKHQSVTGYGYEFSYSEEDGCYYLPLTAIEPIYMPSVTEAVTKGDTVTITLGLVNTSAFRQDSKTGVVSNAEPDKFVKVTLRTSGGTVYIGAVQTTSRPETAMVQVFTDSQ